MTDLNTFIQNELNQAQREAVLQSQGACMVIAGAGSGKTRVITTRIAHLIINTGALPESIIALTFTNKAAKEMKERLQQFLGPTSRLPFVGTFHAYCLLLLRKNHSLAPFEQFSIIDADDQRALLKRIIKRHSLEKQVTASQMSSLISHAKNKEPLEKKASLFSHQIHKEIYLAYEQEKSSAHSIDFDDLLIHGLQAFTQQSAFKERFVEQTEHILVDEYQDTSAVQHELLRAMAQQKETMNLTSLCVVGDQDQSIYSWRGAQVTNMHSFQHYFAPVKIIKIEQNYRSVQPILKAANTLIAHNKNRHEKKLWSEKKAHNRIAIIKCQSGLQEADSLCTILHGLLAKKKKLGSLAVLYRTHFQARVLEEMLIRNAIAYNIVGGIRFYERKEIKDLLAYLRLITNPYDRTSFFRILNCPNRGIGPKTESILHTYWQANPVLNFMQVIRSFLDEKEHELRAPQITALRFLCSLYESYDGQTNPSHLLKNILDTTQYLDYLRRTYEQAEAEIKIENIIELAHSLENWHNPTTLHENDQETEPTLEAFLHDIALLQEKVAGNNTGDQCLTMMTLHSAKGLEFDTVIITGTEDGILPSSRSIGEQADLEEERRLFYVGMTRAKERLILMHATTRSMYGQLTDQRISRFIKELPNKIITELDVSRTHTGVAKHIIHSWLGVIQNKQYTPNISSRNIPKSHSKKPFKAKDIVMHNSFGLGMVKKVEKRGSDYFVTVTFRTEVKRILSTFLKRI